MGYERHTQDVPAWARVVIVGSLLVAPLLIHALVVVWLDEPSEYEFRSTGGLGRHLAWLAVVGLLYVWMIPTTRVSRWVRGALLVPAIHLIAIGAAWALWRSYTPRSEYAADLIANDLPLVNGFPFLWVVGIAAGGILAVAAVWTVAQERKPPTWLGSGVAALLLHLSLLGLWLPLLSSYWPEGPVHAPDDFVLAAVGVPAIIGLAIAFALKSNAGGIREALLFLIAIAALMAIACRASTDADAALAYANGLPLMLAEAAIALAAVVALGAAHWRSLRVVRHETERAAPWTQRGVIEGPERAPVGWLRFDSWLRGLRPELRAFRLHTDSGVLDVPAGSRLVVPLPDATLTMRDGDALPVLCAGDRVVVTGYVLPPDRGPYRTSAQPVPGDTGLIVTLEHERSPSWRDVLLTLWRPCVLYLVAAACVGLPAIAGLLAN